MQLHKTFIFKSRKNNVCFISTHTKFADMPFADIPADIQKWGRSATMQAELNHLAKSEDFSVTVDEVKSNGELEVIANEFKMLGYRVINRRLILKKSNEVI